MGQINTVPETDSVKESPPKLAKETEDNDNEKTCHTLTETERESNLEQGQCVKTRIDMLIEEFLNTEKCPDKDSVKTENSDGLKVKLLSEGSSMKVFSENKFKSTGVLEIKNCKDCCKSDCLNTCEYERKEGSSKCETKKEPKRDLKVSDIITDMVSTELTQKQLKQLQQRTITTFNTFIDKVLDNSLSRESNDEKETKPTNLIELCTESLKLVIKKKNEDQKDAKENENGIEKDVDGNEKPECDRDLDKAKPDVKVSLKDHIERFLEMSFRDENFDDEKKSSDNKKKNFNENFNAQGLVNSMINQGLQINRLLTTKEQLKESAKANSFQKSSESQNKSIHVPEQNVGNQDPQRQRGHGSNSYQHRLEYKSNQHYQQMPVLYVPSSGYSERFLGQSRNEEYVRREEVSDRNREMQMKKNPMVMSKHDLSNMRKTDYGSAFQPPQHLQVANQNFYHQAYGPRMPISPGQLRDMKPMNSQEVKQGIHMRDCPCPMCIHQPQSKHIHGEGISMEHSPGKRSPHMPIIGGHNMVPMLRHPHMEGSYQGIQKLLPYPPTSSSAKLYGGNQLPITGDPAHGMMTARRASYPENHLNPYYYRRGEDFQHSPVGSDHVVVRSTQRSPYLMRPSSVHGHDQSNYVYVRSNATHSPSERDFIRRTDSNSNGSECSSDGPLDLSVKKQKTESSASKANSSIPAVRKINPSNSFIKHLENSVDKYWQELNSPPVSPQHIQSPTPVNRSGTPSDGRDSQSFGGHSSSGSSPPGLLTMIPNRPLPSPQFTGGITVGQPLMDIKPQVSQKQSDYQFSTSPQTSTPVAAQQQSQYPGNQSNFDPKRPAAANVSKHEPIQNIIGQHDPNDILYLICRICSQTYGSPYGFRKHFRNQHGFEPRSDHTIVQTISATKTALHLPHTQLTQGMSSMDDMPSVRNSVSPENEHRAQPSVLTAQTGCKSTASPSDSKSNTGSESDKSEFENSETKCLQCPECGKTFQLNDFGSYKRHCRQHGNVRMNGPLTCSDCHLPFPDQKSLREHYTVHVKDSVPVVKQDVKAEVNQKKSESHQTCYACVKCDMQFDNMDLYTHHLSSHRKSEHNDSEISAVSKSPEKAIVNVKTEKDLSLEVVTSSVNTVVIQAAESFTSLACPDSSWDEGTVSNKSNVNPKLSDSYSSIEIINDENSAQGDSKDENSQSSQNSHRTSVDRESDSGEDNQFALYKHKKFFHHRKRACSLQSQSSCEATEAKRVKATSDSPTSSFEMVCITSMTHNKSEKIDQKSDSCDSNKVNISDNDLEKEGKEVKSTVKTPVKPFRTEARHSLPFVWDRTTRSQKKL